MRQVLTTTFAPTHLDITDDSAQHAGHAGARLHGGGHYAITIVAEQFRGLSSLARHRAIYQALRGELKTAIHALTITAYTPEEWLQLTVK